MLLLERIKRMVDFGEELKSTFMIIRHLSHVEIGQSLFQGFVDAVERKNQSGMTMTDKVK